MSEIGGEKMTFAFPADDGTAGSVQGETAAPFASLDRFAALFDDAPDAILVQSPEGKVIAANRAALRMHGLCRAEIIGQSGWELIPADDRDRARSLLAASHSGDTAELQCRRLHSGGYTVLSEIRGSWVRFDGQPALLLHLRDITARRQAEAKIEHLASHDVLTDLWNRTAFLVRLDSAIEQARRNQRMAAVLFIDLNRFKPINDNHGHATGDAVLRTIADRLKRLVRGSDSVGRLGGDEFGVIVADLPNVAGALTLASKIRGQIEEPIAVDGEQFVVSASIGIALYPIDGEKPDDLLHNADAAMYQAKRRRDLPISLYSVEMAQRLRFLASDEQRLRRALSEHSLYLVYQPLVDLRSLAVIGYEALLRCKTEAGDLAPASLLHAAKECGLTTALGTWVVRHACQQLADWQDRGEKSPILSVNIAPTHFENSSFVDDLKLALNDFQIHPNRLEIDLPETYLARDFTILERETQRVAALGVRLAVDDYGTSAISLSRLRRLPFSRLKIDRRLIWSVDVDPDEAAIVKTLIGIGADLGKEVVAKGIESNRQLEAVDAFGSHAGQGNLLGRPVLPQQITIL